MHIVLDGNEPHDGARGRGEEAARRPGNDSGRPQPMPAAGPSLGNAGPPPEPEPARNPGDADGKPAPGWKALLSRRRVMAAVAAVVAALAATGIAVGVGGANRAVEPPAADTYRATPEPEAHDGGTSAAGVPGGERASAAAKIGISSATGRIDGERAFVSVSGAAEGVGDGAEFQLLFRGKGDRELARGDVRVEPGAETREFGVEVALDYGQLSDFSSVSLEGDGVELATSQDEINRIVAESRNKLVAEWDAQRIERQQAEERQRQEEQERAAAETQRAERALAEESARQSSEMPADIWEVWDEGRAPNYVLEMGPAQVGEIPPAGSVVYGQLDQLGRATGATANITKGLRDRGAANGHDSIPDSETPNGWPGNWQADIQTPSGKNYHGYFWNRSHLVADSLGGDAIRQNLVPGTRMQNVGGNDGKGGMGYTETLARDWIDAHADGTIYYRAVPMYRDGEMIPRSVVVDMRTSDGSIDKRVIVFNAAKGYDVDYSGGGAAPREAPVQSPQPQPAAPEPVTPQPQQPAPEQQAPAEAAQPEPAAEPAPAPAPAEGQSVIITKSGKKYHKRHDCRGLANANSTTTVPIGEARAKGLEPCKICAGG